MSPGEFRPTADLSAAQARRIALAAQGFADPRGSAKPSLRVFDRVLRRTGLFQIDSVNVLARAHYMPLFSRLGPEGPDLLDRAVRARAGEHRIVEYLAHEATFMPVALWPLMQPRMDRWRQRYREGSVDQAMAAWVLEQVAERGPVTARDLDDGRERSREHWGWNWSAAKHALEMHLRTGDLASVERNAAFERRYDLPERVLPPQVRALPVPSEEDGTRELVRRAARSHGVGTAACFADYFRLRRAPVQRAVNDLVEAQELLPVSVEGLSVPTYLHHEAARPRAIRAASLLSPFDPVVWFRPRTEALFDFHYRIEIYTPAHRRVYGYYVLPFLLGDRLVGRVDLKADRRGAGRLLVLGSFAEPGAPEDTAEQLAGELRRLAGWLGLADIEVVDNGDLAAGLQSASGA